MIQYMNLVGVKARKASQYKVATKVKNKVLNDYAKLIKNEKKSMIMFLFVITILAYFYPVIKHAKNKLDCEAIAKSYIIKNKKTTGINNRELKMLSTNFCYGGEEIYEIENLKN